VERRSRRLRPGCVLCRDLPRSASVCGLNSERATPLNNRSKFNVALGIEAQGFCLVKPHS
jgi:hypothetical protein